MSALSDEQLDERIVRLATSLPGLIAADRQSRDPDRRPASTRAWAAVGIAVAMLAGALAVSVAISRPSAVGTGAGGDAVAWPSMRTVLGDLTSARGYVWLPTGIADRVRAIDPSGAIIEVWAPRGYPVAVDVVEHGDAPDRALQELLLGAVSPGTSGWLDPADPRLVVTPGGTGMAIVQRLPGGIAMLEHEVVDGASTWTMTLQPDGLASIGQVEPSPWASPMPSDSAGVVGCLPVVPAGTVVPMGPLASGQPLTGTDLGRMSPAEADAYLTAMGYCHDFRYIYYLPGTGNELYSELWCVVPPDGGISGVGYGRDGSVTISVGAAERRPRRAQPAHGWGCPSLR